MIPKKQFKEILNLIKKQHDKDTKFADFMESYLDGRCVPTMSTEMQLAFEKLFFHNVECGTDYYEEDKSTYDMTWIEWFIYECNWGKSPMSATIDGKEFVVNSIDVFYSLLKRWEKYAIKESAEKNKSLMGPRISMDHNMCKYCKLYTKDLKTNCGTAETLYVLRAAGKCVAPVIECKHFQKKD
jgi:hypothetical protein